MNINDWVRPNILKLKPYSSARSEFTGDARVFLDANENPYNSPYNRYPDPLQRKLKDKIAEIKGIRSEQLFLGNGSDEPIDLLIRAFCEPGKDRMLQIEPTYGMYQVAAEINNVEVVKVPLTDSYQLDATALIESISPETRLIFLCSPNNPSGNALDAAETRKILEHFEGPVVVDEAYIDFAPGLSMLHDLEKYDNLIVLQTFSKAWGMAGIRLGMAFADEKVIRILNKIKYPYNINILTQQKVLEMLVQPALKETWVRTLVGERNRLAGELTGIPFVERVWPSDANFFLVTMKNAREVYLYLVEKGIIIRDRSQIRLCENSLRITVGTKEENRILVEALKNYDNNRE